MIRVAGPTEVAEGSSLTFTVVLEALTISVGKVTAGTAAVVVVGVSGTAGPVVETVEGQQAVVSVTCEDIRVSIVLLLSTEETSFWFSGL